MKRTTALALVLISGLFFATGCVSGTVPWADPSSDEDSALLCRVKADIQCTAGSWLDKCVIVFAKEGDPKNLEYTLDLSKQKDYPNDPLLLKVTPGKWVVQRADFYVKPGPYFDIVCTSPKFTEFNWVEIGPGEVGLGHEVAFKVDFKVEGDRWNARNMVSITYGHNSRLSILEDALLYAQEGTPWHSRLIKAKEKLMKEKEEEEKKNEEQKAKEEDKNAPAPDKKE